MKRREVQRQAIRILRESGEPTRCGRCGGRPGDPGCGKIIHVVMDAVYEEAQRMMEMKEEE